jgi:hypothetical protein
MGNNIPLIGIKLPLCFHAYSDFYLVSGILHLKHHISSLLYLRFVFVLDYGISCLNPPGAP